MSITVDVVQKVTGSDERINEAVNDRLSDDYYLDASDIEVVVGGFVLTSPDYCLSHKFPWNLSDLKSLFVA